MSTPAERRISVLHPITRLIIGGAQENTMLTAQLLDNSRWDVSIICGPQTGAEGSLIETVRERGISLEIEPNLVREVHPIKDLRATWHLTNYMRRGGFTIVHTHSSKAGILGRWAAKWAGVPIIVHTVHGWGHHDHQHPLVRWVYIALEKLTLSITDKLIVVSALNREKGLMDGIGAAEDYTVIRSGIELDKFGHPQKPRSEMRAILGIPLDAPVVGTVTRLSPQKAPLDFVRAASAIHAKRPDTYFVIVGDGPLRPAVETLVRRSGLAEQTILTGLRRDVPELMTTFDIFALSSLWEGLPRVLPQAMASVLPIVATRTDGNAEVVRDGENGWLVPPGEPVQLAKAVLSLLNEPERAHLMGQMGREMVREYGVNEMIEKIDSLYSTLLQKKNL